MSAASDLIETDKTQLNSDAKVPPINIVLHGYMENIELRKDFTGYAIMVCIPHIMHRRIRQLLEQDPYNTTLEKFSQDFILMRMLEGKTNPVQFICIGVSLETLSIIQIFYPVGDRFMYDIQSSPSMIIAKYPEYFQLIEPKPPSMFCSPVISAPPLHDDRISCIISNQLYLSGSTGAENLAALTALEITHIINISDLIPNYYEDLTKLEDNIKQFKYLRIAIPDCGSIRLKEYIPVVFNFIDEALSSGGRILVHCFAGKSRSSSFVIAYIMKTRNMNFNEALIYVQERRQVVEPNLGFGFQLKELENTFCTTQS
jgi:protein-tyrosine phosphatase